MLYSKGLCEQDYPRAHIWFNIAASLGHKKSVTQRQKLVEVLTESELEQAQQLVHKCIANKYKACKI
jgi:TPR repeat protein